MKFNEKIISLRKKKGLSQEELGQELQVSRQTVSKWESGQSYPDFQRLVMLSDYFDMTLDELVRDVDVQDVRNRNLTDEKVAALYADAETLKNRARKWAVIFCYACLILTGIVLLGFLLHVLFPNLEWLWGSTEV